MQISEKKMSQNRKSPSYERSETRSVFMVNSEVSSNSMDSQRSTDLSNVLNLLEKAIDGVRDLDTMDVKYWQNRALVAESQLREARHETPKGQEALTRIAAKNLAEVAQAPTVSRKSYSITENFSEVEEVAQAPTVSRESYSIPENFSEVEEDQENDQENDEHRKTLVGQSLREKWNSDKFFAGTGCTMFGNSSLNRSRSAERHNDDISPEDAENLVKKYLNMDNPYETSTGKRVGKGVMKNAIPPLTIRREV